MKNKLIISAILLGALALTGCDKKDDVLTLKVANWEEYIDLGDWGEDETIELDNGKVILGEQSMVDDFEDWYFENYGERIKVDYSTFGTNEDLYNQITLGDVYDLVCPSEYMITKLAREELLEKYDESFYDREDELNYYSRGVSPYISSVFSNLKLKDASLDRYAAGYMWGTLGIVYNPELITEEEAAHWSLLTDKHHYKQITVKDSVRDAYFAGLAMNRSAELLSPAFVNDPDYHEKLTEALNCTDPEIVEEVQEILTRVKENVYSFETDAGKADMVTGKIAANQQWSGDAVFIMQQAAEEGLSLRYSAPEEGTNLWFDGWVMLKKGINGDERKKKAAQAFVNFISMPENAVRNMYYIGYTSVIAGGDDDTIYQYINYNYAGEDEAECVPHRIGYFFGDEADEEDRYTVYAEEDSDEFYQLDAQYPTKEVIDRSVVMACFEEEDNIRINRMWTNIRCFDLRRLFML